MKEEDDKNKKEEEEEVKKKEDVCNNSPTSHKHFPSERLHSNDSKEVKCYTKH